MKKMAQIDLCIPKKACLNQKLCIVFWWWLTMCRPFFSYLEGFRFWYFAICFLSFNLWLYDVLMFILDIPTHNIFKWFNSTIIVWCWKRWLLFQFCICPWWLTSKYEVKFSQTPFHMHFLQMKDKWMPALCMHHPPTYTWISKVFLH